MLFKLLEDSKSDKNLQKPTHFAVIFDSARKTFRNEIYSDYKANRSEAPDDLAPQFDYIRKSVLAFNLPSVELINYEADDLIATYTDKILKPTQKLQDELFQEMKSRIKEDDTSVPYYYNDYWYMRKYEKGKDCLLYTSPSPRD